MGKYRIEVLHPGGLKGYTTGAVIDAPTPEQIAEAKGNKALRLIVDGKTEGEPGPVPAKKARGGAGK